MAERRAVLPADGSPDAGPPARTPRTDLPPPAEPQAPAEERLSPAGFWIFPAILLGALFWISLLLRLLGGWPLFHG